jgi:hypothetical protein
MGDAPAQIAERQLQAAQPYPGDTGQPFTDESRFLLVRIPEKEATYLINDLAHDDFSDPAGYCIEIERKNLLDPKFNLPQWYATQLANRLQLGVERYPRAYNFRMGDVYLHMLACRLKYGECRLPDPLNQYDRHEEGNRFRFERRDDTYYIIDYGESMLTEISKDLLERPQFAILPWYRKCISEQRKRRRIVQPVYVTSKEDRDPKPIGDILSISAEELLTRAEPYPGDNSVHKQNRRRRRKVPRFKVSRVSEDHYMIQDSFRGTEAFILTEHLHTPEFLLAKWYAEECERQDMSPPSKLSKRFYQLMNGDSLADGAAALLQTGGPYPGDEYHFVMEDRFEVLPDPESRKCYRVLDYMRNIEVQLPRYLLEDPDFDIFTWYDKQLKKPRAIDPQAENDLLPNEDDFFFILDEPLEEPEWAYAMDQLYHNTASALRTHMSVTELELNGVQIPRDQLSAVERNAAVTRDATRVVPKPVVVVTRVNGQSVRALIDSGSLGDFMSTTLADQLRVKRINLEKPLPLQLAVQGSRSKINAGTKVQFQYQEIKEERYFDIINISNYDLILGTPWLFQHRVTIGLNPSTVVIGSRESLPLKGELVTKIASRALTAYNDGVERIREHLMCYADPICVENIKHDLPLPPLRAINHTVPLIDEEQVYPWRPARCPEALRPQWIAKRDVYLRTGRWKLSTATSTAPMLMIMKSGTNPPLLRVVNDLRKRNLNTKKMASPLPSIEGILRRVASKRCVSLADISNAFEQIRIIPAHVPRTAVTTPDGTMVSLVVQQGDCNAPATCQALMNHIFAAYLGVWMDVYLDDIIVYSDTLEEHVEHVKIVIDLLTKEKLYLSKRKLQFLCKELKVLGHVIDVDSIRMDPAKVDNVLAWKVPMNRDLL